MSALEQMKTSLVEAMREHYEQGGYDALLAFKLAFDMTYQEVESVKVSDVLSMLDHCIATKGGESNGTAKNTH